MADTTTTTNHYPAQDISFSEPCPIEWDGQTIGTKFSIFNIYKVLAAYVSAYEKGMAEAIDKINGKNSNQVDQGTLLELQAMVQTWSTVSATATGIVRALGDALIKISQNIR